MKKVSMLIKAGLCLGLMIFGSSRSMEENDKQIFMELMNLSRSDEISVDVRIQYKNSDSMILWGGVLGRAGRGGTLQPIIYYSESALFTIPDWFLKKEYSLKFTMSLEKDRYKIPAYSFVIVSKQELEELKQKGTDKLAFKFNTITHEITLQALDKNGREIWEKSSKPEQEKK